jgi:hypothetical protein
MKPAQVKEHFRSGYRFYKETGMSPANISNWMAWGFVPIASQFKLEEKTKGKLKASWKDIKK